MRLYSSESTRSSSEQDAFERRISMLSGGIAILAIGAETPVAVEQKKARVKAALRVTRAGIRGGVVAGGGYTLARLSAEIHDSLPWLVTDGQRQGANAVSKALVT